MKTHDKLVRKAKPNDKKSDYFQSVHIEFFEEKYCDAAAAVEEQITKITASQAALVNDSTHNQSIVLEHSHEHEVRLPPLELPTFSGEYTEWASFADRFVSAVHKRKIPEASKLVYLKSVLRGDAVALISEMATTDTNYMTAWNLLKETYENKRVIFNHAMNTLLNFETQKKESSAAFKAIIGTTDATRQSNHSTVLASIKQLLAQSLLIWCAKNYPSKP